MILDTNALSAVVEGAPAAVAELSKTQVAAVPVIVLAEYMFGIAQSRRRLEYEQWLNESLASYRLLEIEADTAARYAQLRLELKVAGTPIPANDAWIAALCLQHSLPLLSRDRHFDVVKGIRRIAW